MTGLWEWAASSSNRADAEALDGPWRWLVSGGRPPRRDKQAAVAALYCTGHADGSVRLWDTQVGAGVGGGHRGAWQTRRWGEGWGEGTGGTWQTRRWGPGVG
jgi:hypothetical protein